MQVSRELYPRCRNGDYVRNMDLVKGSVSKEARDMFERLEELIIHRVQIIHDETSKEIRDYIRG